MTEEWYPDEQLHEAANQPRGSALRKQLEVRLEAAPAVERQYWLGVLRLTDRLYSEVAAVAAPGGMEERLLRIPDQTPQASRYAPLKMQRLFNWKSIAAAILIVIAAGNIWKYWTSLPSAPEPLATDVATLISRDTVQFVDKHPALDVANNDSTSLQSALGSRGMPFPVMVLHPRAQLDLLGGGTCDVEGNPAVYTRWQGQGQEYTVFQFDGKKLGVPANFTTTAQTPTDLWHGTQHYHVSIWPGKIGGCTWVLVMESDGAQDLFSGAYY